MDTLQVGITAAREGRRAEARVLLHQALQANPRSEQGWLWMSVVVETDAERRICLERVLTINPHNQTARAGLERLEAGNGLEQGVGSHLPIHPSSPSGNSAQGVERGKAAVAHMPPAPAVRPPSPHSLPTLGMAPVAPDARRITRLAPEPDPMDGLDGLRAAQVQPRSSYQPESASQSDPFMALVLIGGLTITAIAGALMLAVLWLVGWPP